MSKQHSELRQIFVAFFVAIVLISSLQPAHGYYVQVNPSMQALAAQYQQVIQQQQLMRQYTQSQIDYIKSLFQRLTLGTLGEEQREEIEDFFDQYNEKVQEQQQQQQEYQQQLVEQQQQYEQQTQKYQQTEEDDDDEKKQEQSTQQPQYEQQTQKYQEAEEDDDDGEKKQEQSTQQPQYEQQTQKYQEAEEDDDDGEKKQEQSTQQPQYEQQTQKYQQAEEEEDDDDEKKQEQSTQQPQYEQQTQKYQQAEEEDDDDDEKKQEQSTQQPQYEQQTKKYQQLEEEDDDSTEVDCGGYKAFPNDPRFYLQFDGVNWLKRPCPEGLGFTVEKCACVIRIPSYVTPSTTTATTTRRTSTTPTPPPTTTTTRSTTTSTTTTTPEPTTTRKTTTTSTTTPQPTTTRMTTTGKPSLDLCKDCVMLHGVGYAPYRGHCDAYIQCQYYGDVPSSVNIRYCTGGLQWNQDKLTCDYPENVKCQSVVTKCQNKQAVVGDSQGYLVFNGYSWSQLSCPPNKVYSDLACDCVEKRGEVYFETCLDKKPIPNDRTGFLQLSASGWIRMPCPRTLGYNVQTCRCTDFLNTDNQYTLCPNLKPIPGDKTGYLQFNGVSWLRMPCPATVGYNPRTCQCSDYLTDDDKSESIDKDDNDFCKPELILNFDDNSATDLSHNQFWINNTGVTFRNGQAIFDGSSRLTIPGFSNMDLGDTVFITLKYNQSGYGKQTVLTNGDCGVLQSVGVCSDSESVDFFVETGSQQAKVHVPRMINSWQYVMYSLYKDHLKGHVGTRSSTREVKGSVARRQRGLVIGGGGECGGFTGVIDEIHVFLCYPGYA